MPANKNQRIRCLVLDKCLRNTSKNYQIEDLVAAVNEELGEILPQGGAVSKRTIYNDITFMQSPEGGLADIIKYKEGVKVFYRYQDTTFSIAGNPFTEEERQYMRALVATLSKFRGLPQMETLRESLSNINLLSLEPSAEPCMEFEENPYIKGIEHLQYLYNAIISKSVQELTYEPYGKERRSYRFHPQYLKQYNHRWYVLGVTTEHPDNVSNFPLDRIISIKPINDKYMDSIIAWNEYFEDVIGVSIPKTEIEEVHLLFHGKTGHYIQSNPLHQSQRSRWIDSNTLEVRLNIRINYELQRTLMSYADSITILAPVELRNEMRNKLMTALKITNNS